MSDLKIRCCQERLYVPDSTRVLRVLQGLADDASANEEISQNYRDLLLEKAQQVESAQQLTEEVFSEIGLYKHCLREGCCAPAIGIEHLSGTQLEVNAVLLASQETKVVVNLDRDLGHCTFFGRDMHCTLPVKPYMCLKFRNCITGHVPGLDEGFGLYDAAIQEFRQAKKANSWKPDYFVPFAHLSSLGKMTPLEKYFAIE
jgi:hypothetical protein